MSQRLNHIEVAPEAMAHLFTLENYIKDSFKDLPFNHNLLELIKLRVSQINYCAFCIDMHSNALIRMNEPTDRLIALSAWEDSELYSDTERMAFRWAEKITACDTISDTLYDEASALFGEKNLVNLTVAVNAINSWNRVCKAFRPPIGMLNPK